MKISVSRDQKDFSLTFDNADDDAQVPVELEGHFTTSVSDGAIEVIQDILFTVGNDNLWQSALFGWNETASDLRRSLARHLSAVTAASARGGRGGTSTSSRGR